MLLVSLRNVLTRSHQSDAFVLIYDPFCFKSLTQFHNNSYSFQGSRSKIIKFQSNNANLKFFNKS